MAYTAIDNPGLYFAVQLRTAATGDPEYDIGFQPNMVWDKCRSIAGVHALYDSVRGVGASGKVLYPHTTGGEADNALMKSFDSDGFTIESDADHSAGVTLVDWCWKETATAGFDIVSYTGNGSARTISHSLSAVPKFIIVKNRESDENWRLYHAGVASDAETDEIYLDLTNAAVDTDSAWNDTAPTSSVFSVGTNHGVNKSDEGHIAYLFADVQGFSKFGSYVGNGNANGTFVYTGFRPAMVIIKTSSYASQNWGLWDTKRDTGNITEVELNPNDNSPDDSTGNKIDILSNGFKCKVSYDATNRSGETYIYMAWAEAPLVNSEGVPCNAR